MERKFTAAPTEPLPLEEQEQRRLSPEWEEAQRLISEATARVSARRVGGFAVLKTEVTGEVL